MKLRSHSWQLPPDWYLQDSAWLELIKIFFEPKKLWRCQFLEGKQTSSMKIDRMALCSAA